MLALVCSYCGSDWFANAGRLAHMTTHAGHSQEEFPKKYKSRIHPWLHRGEAELGC